MRVDVHQHVWSGPFLEALARREELPFVRVEQGLTVLYLAGERPYVIDVAAESAANRTGLIAADGLDRALVCLSSPLGIEALPRTQASDLIAGYLAGSLALGEDFRVWGAIALDGLDPLDVDAALDRGCIGLSLPAGALGSLTGLARLSPVLSRLERRGAPLLIHPGAGFARFVGETSLGDPLWWPALTRYVAEMQAAWFAFAAAGRRSHPELRVIFTMLAGLAPLNAQRLTARGGPEAVCEDPFSFYEISSYGPLAVQAIADVVGPGQLLYGSDRPVVERGDSTAPAELDWEVLVEATARALGERAVRALGRSRLEAVVGG